jgi:hypothetical protein
MVAAQLLSGRITNFFLPFNHAFAQSEVFLLILVEKLLSEIRKNFWHKLLFLQLVIQIQHLSSKMIARLQLGCSISACQKTETRKIRRVYEKIPDLLRVSLDK